ncbi:MAG: PIG-L family deacetylase [Thaumarchaeota archaeon]|nr:PIG-L family deacetylase [Nitrososphaerota archaeon]
MSLDLAWQRLLVVAPHPDDEVLGCGGLIPKVKKAGGEVHVLVMTVGSIAQYGGKSDTKVRIKELERVAKFLRFDSYYLALPGDKYHLCLDQVPKKKLVDIIESGEKVSLSAIKPTMVCIPYLHSTNQDHVAVAEAAFTACRPVGGKSKPIPKIVLSYEQPEISWSRAVFNPNFFVDIGSEIRTKIEALKLYSSQIRKEPHPRSAENIVRIAESRGRQVGVKAAEAFECHRLVL